MSSLEDHKKDIRKYARGAIDDAVVAGFHKTYRLVMSKADSRYVACSDENERAAVKRNFLKKKLGLTHSDAELDKAIEEVCQAMKDDRTKSRLTFYYLLAEKFGKLSQFA